jgi:hypothetical protein
MTSQRICVETSSTSWVIIVAPGTKVEKVIVCLKTPPDRVRVRWSWPADLEKEQLVLYAPFAFRHRKLEPGLSWMIGDSAPPRRARRRANQQMMMGQAQSGPAIRSVLCGPATTLTEILDRKGLFFWTICRFDENGQRVEEPSSGVWAEILMENLRDVKLPSATPEPHELTWEAGVYGLDKLIVLRPTRSPNVEADRRRLEVLVGSFVYGGGPAVQIRGDSVRVYDGIQDRSGSPSKKDLDTITPGFGGAGIGGMAGGMGGGGGNNFGRMGGGMGGGGGNNDGSLAWQDVARTIELPAEYWDKVDLGFEARLGEVNEWTIPLPDELLKAVREALKVDPAAKKKPASPTIPTHG